MDKTVRVLKLKINLSYRKDNMIDSISYIEDHEVFDQSLPATAALQSVYLNCMTAALMRTGVSANHVTSFKVQILADLNYGVIGEL